MYLFRAGDIMIPLDKYPHIPYWYTLQQALAEMEINEIQVEAGASLCGALLHEHLVDEILLYQAPILLGDDALGPFALGPLESMAERSHLEVLEITQFGDDLRIRLQPEIRC